MLLYIISTSDDVVHNYEIVSPISPKSNVRFKEGKIALCLSPSISLDMPSMFKQPPHALISFFIYVSFVSSRQR